MRARLLALTLVPLLGMAAFAFLWTSDRYDRADQAEKQRQTTAVITKLADLVVDVEIDNKVSAAAGSAGSGAASIGFIRDARVELQEHRTDLASDAARIDQLAGRRGSWARVAVKLDAMTRTLDNATRPPGGHAKTKVDETALLGEIGHSVASGTTDAPTGVAARDALHDLIRRMSFASDSEAKTLTTMVRSTALDEAAINEILTVVGHASSGSWNGAAAELRPLGDAQARELETLTSLVGRTQAIKLQRLVDGPVGSAWEAIRGQAIAADTTGAPGPSIMKVGVAAYPWIGALIAYRTQLSQDLRDAAAERADTARRDAYLATIIAALLAAITLMLAVTVARSIRRSLRALDVSESFSRAIVTTAPTAIWTVDADGYITTSNPAGDKLLGEATTGRLVEDVLGRDVAAAVGHGAGEALDNEEVWLRRPDGSRVPVLLGTSQANEVWTVFARDIAELKEYETQLSHQAFHDELTGLPNRSLLLDRIEHALARRERDSDWSVALIMVDLDDFKAVNDALGHAAGDELLISVAARLSTCLRPGDTAARLGGDEFAVLLEGSSEPGDAGMIAERLVEILQLPLRAGDRDLAVSASVGLKMADRDATPQTLLRDADIAMYAAKDGGKARARAFTTAMHEDATRRLELRNDLSNALARDELRLVYQPMIELANRQIVGAEALLRWQHPEHGVIAPLDFIPVAEETGLIVPIGRWVLLEACRTAASWPSNGTALGVSVNVSGAQLVGDDIVDAVRTALDDSGISPDRLTIELTESVLIDDIEAVMPALEGLKELGVTIAIDDFGTGYSSLAYLRRFPLDHLKIDRAFIRDLTGASGDRSLARSIVDLAGVLGLSAVAEGVETAEQADLLTALACDFAQGYHFSRPIEPAELSALIARGPVASEIVS